MSRYYARDADDGPDPGYPVLAVSDPAADVTSTQTWRAIAEGRSTGIWAAPAGLRGDAGNAAATSPPARTRSGPHTGPRSGSPTAPRPGPRPAPRSGPYPTLQPGLSGSQDTQASPAAGVAAPAPARRHRWPLSVRLAIAAALVLVLAAAGSLGYFVLHTFHSQPLSPAAQSAGRSSPSASPSPSLGPFGHIETRQSDPQPLTVAQLYPARYVENGATVALTAANLGTNCAGAITGATLQTAVSWAGCSQVARATYLSASQGLMGTIGVLNLTTAARAKTAEQSADANDFINQLPAASGPAHKIGQGTGIEQAAAKGHYLILIWAQLTSLGKPNAAQTAELESFMAGLLQNTANVSLSSRLLTGTP